MEMKKKEQVYYYAGIETGMRILLDESRTF